MLNVLRKLLLVVVNSSYILFLPFYFSVTDALHAYFGVCGMSLLGENKLEKINAALNVSQRAADNLARIHSYWRNKGSSSLSLINWCLSPTQDLHLALHVSYIVKTLSSLGSLQQADMIR